MDGIRTNWSRAHSSRRIDCVQISSFLFQSLVRCSSVQCVRSGELTHWRLHLRRVCWRSWRTHLALMWWMSRWRAPWLCRWTRFSTSVQSRTDSSFTCAPHSDSARTWARTPATRPRSSGPQSSCGYSRPAEDHSGTAWVCARCRGWTSQSGRLHTSSTLTTLAKHRTCAARRTPETPKPTSDEVGCLVRAIVLTGCWKCCPWWRWSTSAIEE